MEDEVFEKYFERIEGVNEHDAFGHLLPFDERKAKLKEILEEIYNEGVEKGTDMFLVELDR